MSTRAGADLAGTPGNGPEDPSVTLPAQRATVLRGIGVGRQAALGPVVRVHHPPTDPATVEHTDTAAAVDALREAFSVVAGRLEDRAAAAEGTAAEVLEATATMARDTELVAEAVDRVTGGENPVRAVDGAVAGFVELFQQAGGYLAERATDLRSVRDRVVAELAGLPEPGVPALTHPAVLVADDLAPADTVGLQVDRVLAIVLAAGGPTGHTAIIARQLGIPCVVQVGETDLLTEGLEVAVDAATGTVTTSPGDEVRAAVTARTEMLTELGNDRSPGGTADDHPVALMANIGTPQDAERCREHGAQGVGLYRTEVLFLGRSAAPDVTEQTETYRRVLGALPGSKVVFRTLDAGADKPLSYLGLPEEDNPALGVRGYRLVRLGTEHLREQLTAIARAGSLTGTDPWVMAPMVATAAEARAFAALARAAGIRHAGVMVEVPAAALRARAILAEVDFVSIGTNDLTQYVMAADRLRGELADLLDPWQPAVLDLVARVAEAGQEVGKPVGVCGEAAADPLLALVLVGLGVTSLSMAPAALAGVRFTLSRHRSETCRRAAEAALAAGTPEAARAAAADLVEEEVRAVLAL